MNRRKGRLGVIGWGETQGARQGRCGEDTEQGRANEGNAGHMNTGGENTRKPENQKHKVQAGCDIMYMCVECSLGGSLFRFMAYILLYSSA